MSEQQGFPDDPQAQAAQQPPAQPQKRLIINHETIALELADKPWVFRTLGFMDATIVQPHMVVLANLLTKTEPVPTAAEGMTAFRALLEQVNPTLAHDEALVAITQPFFMAVVNFYFNKHDWGRMVEMAAASLQRRDEGGANIPPHLVFLLVCANAAASQGLTTQAFLDSRFEYAVDVILAMHERHKQAKQEEGYQGPEGVAMALAAMFGEVTVNEDTAPEWVKALVGDPRHARQQKN